MKESDFDPIATLALLFFLVCVTMFFVITIQAIIQFFQ